MPSESIFWFFSAQQECIFILEEPLELLSSISPDPHRLLLFCDSHSGKAASIDFGKPTSSRASASIYAGDTNKSHVSFVMTNRYSLKSHKF